MNIWASQFENNSGPSSLFEINSRADLGAYLALKRFQISFFMVILGKNFVKGHMWQSESKYLSETNRLRKQYDILPRQRGS